MIFSILESFLFSKNRKADVIFFVFISITTIFFLFGLLKLETDENIKSLLPNNKKIRQEIYHINKLSKKFPDNSYLFIGVEDNPFTLKKIKWLWMFCNEIESLDCVESVLSPFNTFYFIKLKNDFFIRLQNKHHYPKSDEELKIFMNNLKSTRFSTGTVISYDCKNAGIVVTLKKNIEIKENPKDQIFLNKLKKYLIKNRKEKNTADNEYIIREIETVIKKYNNYFGIKYSGIPVFEAKTKELSKKDFNILLLFAILIIIIVFFINFRIIKISIYPVICTSLTLVFTIGLMGWMNVKLGPIGSMIPPLIITISSSYTLHYLNSYYYHINDDMDIYAVTANVTKHIFPTIFTASITTIIAFSSFLITSFKAIRQMAVFLIISIIISVFLTFTLLPGLIRQFSKIDKNKIKKINNDLFSKFSNNLIKAVYPLRYLYIIFFFIVLILFFIFIPGLKTESRVEDLFENNDTVYSSLLFFQEKFGGIVHFNITLRSIGNEGFFHTREGILAAEKIQDYLDKNIFIKGYSTIGWNISAVTLLQDINNVMNDTRGIPGEKTIKRFISYLKVLSKTDKNIQTIINEDASIINFHVRTNTDNSDISEPLNSKDFKLFETKIIKDLNEIAEKDGRYKVEVWGDLFLMSRISYYLIVDQIKSPLITLFLVFIVSLIIFRSINLSVFSVVPLTFGIAGNFLIMSISRIPLDTITIMIASISIGIGIDDSAHFIIYYKRQLNNGIKPREAVKLALQETSRPIVFTSLALIGGFIIFIFSQFIPVKYFGLLVSLAVLNCTVATIFILPSFFLVTDELKNKFKIKRKIN